MQKIYEFRDKDLNLNEIEKKLGFTHKQVRDFVYSENKKRKVEAGITISQKGDHENHTEACQ